MSDDNIACTIAEQHRQQPFARAVVVPGERDRAGRRAYRHVTFAQLDTEVDRLARGFASVGVKRGMRVLLAIRPGLEFVSVSFALFRIGAVPVMIDPGMKRSSLLTSITRAKPEVFIGIPLAHAFRVLAGGGAFRTVQLNITAGRKWFWGGETLDSIARRGDALADTPVPDPGTKADDTAAILFTSGATGPAKGVVYTHAIFGAQVGMLGSRFGIKPGDIDLAGFPLFGLFSVSLGATLVVPDMNASRPSTVDPELFIESIVDQGVTYSFASPAVWQRVIDWCRPRKHKLGSLRLIMAAGAPIRPAMYEGLRSIVRDHCEIVSPYGATECLPATTIDDREVASETGEKTRCGEGICVGKPLDGMEVKVIRVTDEPVPLWSENLEVDTGEPGEICFAGPVVTEQYFQMPEADKRSKIRDNDRVWHRTGDVGTLDEQGRIWFYGRKAHRVTVSDGASAQMWFPIRCEAVFNEHTKVRRAALVGVGTGEYRRPVIAIEPEDGHFPKGPADVQVFVDELKKLAEANAVTRDINVFLFHPGFPLDPRHNAKIIREELALWATKELA